MGVNKKAKVDFLTQQFVETIIHSHSLFPGV